MALMTVIKSVLCCTPKACKKVLFVEQSSTKERLLVTPAPKFGNECKQLREHTLFRAQGAHNFIIYQSSFAEPQSKCPPLFLSRLKIEQRPLF
jgi:hypothetical protein